MTTDHRAMIEEAAAFLTSKFARTGQARGHGSSLVARLADALDAATTDRPAHSGHKVTQEGHPPTYCCPAHQDGYGWLEDAERRAAKLEEETKGLSGVERTELQDLRDWKDEIRQIIWAAGIWKDADEAEDEPAAVEQIVSQRDAAIARADTAESRAAELLDHLQQASDEIRELSADRDAVLIRADAAERRADELEAERDEVVGHYEAGRERVIALAIERAALARDLAAARAALIRIRDMPGADDAGGMTWLAGRIAADALATTLEGKVPA